MEKFEKRIGTYIHVGFTDGSLVKESYKAEDTESRVRFQVKNIPWRRKW